MRELRDTADRTAVCGTCGEPLSGRRYLQAEGALLHTFCSEPCLRAAQEVDRKRRWKARRRGMKVVTIGVAVAGACLAPHQGREARRPASVAPAPPPAADAAAVLPPGWFGPEWPPSETSLLAALGRDAWIHPLAGPIRRMPRADSRVFGAPRPSNRPVECRNGHCGVDLGGEIWGEQVHAVHEGVVDFVQRNANPDRGGEFVRIAHHNGTVFTQYFHLAAIRRGIERGVRVKCGEVIGLLGDTGVQDSAPHLHFALSIRPSPDRPEKYMDPEPLIALWPLRVPIDAEAGLVTTVSQPGVPLGSMPLLPGRKQRLAQLKHRAPASRSASEAGAAAADEEPAAEAAPAAESSGDE